MLFSQFGVKDWQKHATSHPWIGPPADYVKHPICPRCERIALRDRGWQKNRLCRCPACGWSGQATMLMKEYVHGKEWRS